MRMAHGTLSRRQGRAPRSYHLGITVSDYEKFKAFYQIGEGGPDFWKPGNRAGAAPVHIAFVARDRAAVDAFHAAELAAGGTDHGAPGLRPHYHPDYYGAFILDPDGNNVEAVWHGPAAT
jgi:catechol 2,3-dioxygenase-like lactoylglutathione lyase family enzyme